MDIREVPQGNFNRHPWEISRTEMLLGTLDKYTGDIRKEADSLVVADIGAGDMYFDKVYLERFPQDKIFAVDIGYTDFSSDRDNLFMSNTLEQVPEPLFDMTFSLNSLEYIPDEKEFLKKLSNRLRPGGLIFFILPAHRFLFSEHDVFVKGLRRYGRKEFKRLIESVDELELLDSFYFYASLFAIRGAEKMLRIPTDRAQKNVPSWRYSAEHPVTRLFTAFLNADFKLCYLLSRLKIRVPGLSILAVCVRK
ncbi:MAG: methyltransferase domain-containing protein [Acutalibacteraceae bacterium]|jgi:SAM-dependent methyltransferase